MPFEEARAYIRAQNLSGTEEWERYSKSKHRPADIPSNPNKIYADHGWVSMGDWIGTGNVHPSRQTWLRHNIVAPQADKASDLTGFARAFTLTLHDPLPRKEPL